MQNLAGIVCDGCGQPASSEHIARRLKRLEQMTRYRPIHVQALFLGGISPESDEEYLYNAESGVRGESEQLMQALGIAIEGRAADAILTEFQRRGLLLAHLIDCGSARFDPSSQGSILRRRLDSVLVKIRRSYKPRRLIPIGAELAELVPRLAAQSGEAQLLLRGDKPFDWNHLQAGELTKELAAASQTV